MVLVSGSFGLNQKYGALIPAMDIPVKISMEPNQTTKLQRMPSSSKPPFLGSMLIFQGVVDFRPLLKPEISSTEIFFQSKQTCRLTSKERSLVKANGVLSKT